MIKFQKSINGLNIIKSDYYEYLKKLAENIYSSLNQNKKQIIESIKSIPFEQKDLISITFIINKELQDDEEIQKIKELNKFNINEEYFSPCEIDTKIEELKYSKSNITFLVDNSENIGSKFSIFAQKEESNLEGIFQLEFTLKNILNSINLLIKSRINIFKKKFMQPFLPKKYSYYSEGILDFIKLTKKIDDELKIKIYIKIIDDLVKIISFDIKEK